MSPKPDESTRSASPEPSPTTPTASMALVLTGGGARAAYQVGLLQFLARQYPDLRFDILTGVSAGAINASFLASHTGSFAEAVNDLSDLWTGLTPDEVFRVDGLALAKSVARWGVRLLSGGSRLAPTTRGLVDTAPLENFLRGALEADSAGNLAGIQANLELGRLQSLALTAVDWSTGRTVTWVQGALPDRWRRPTREGRSTEIQIRHIMASAALPLLFPAVEVDGSWFGDGGVRLTYPLSPALHLGADRILAISTRFRATGGRSRPPDTVGYPPPVQVAGILMNAIFLDQLDQDAMRLHRINQLLQKVPEEHQSNLRPVGLTIIRPSRDLGRLAGSFEPGLPPAFRFLTRGLGTRQTASPDLLSMLMFQPDYVQALIECGRRDAEAHQRRIAKLIVG